MNNPNISDKIVYGQHFKWKEGQFFIWNVPGINLPLYTYIEMIYSIRPKCKTIDRIIYSVAEKQAVIAVDYMRQKFGFKKEKDIIDSVLGQIAFLGLGQLKLVQLQLDVGRGLFKNEKNPFAIYHKQMYGSSPFPVDAYLAGVIAGTIEGVTGKTLVCLETKCIAKGDSACIFELMPANQVKGKLAKYNFSSLLGPDKIRDISHKEKASIATLK